MSVEGCLLSIIGDAGSVTVDCLFDTIESPVQFMLHEDSGAIGVQSDVISATTGSGNTEDDDSHDDRKDPKRFYMLPLTPPLSFLREEEYTPPCFTPYCVWRYRVSGGN